MRLARRQRHCGQGREMRPGASRLFAQRYTEFEQKLTQADSSGWRQMKPYAEGKLSPPSDSWPNFAEPLGLNCEVGGGGGGGGLRGAAARHSGRSAAHCGADRPNGKATAEDNRLRALCHLKGRRTQSRATLAETVVVIMPNVAARKRDHRLFQAV